MGVIAVWLVPSRVVVRVRGRRRRRPGERILLGVIAGLVVVSGMAGIAMGYVVWRLGQVDRLRVADALTVAPDRPVTAADVTRQGSGLAAVDSTVTVPGIDTVEEVVVHRPDRPEENYLVVGTDSVEGIAADDVIQTNREANADNHLADTIMVLRLRPDGSAALVSVPRDLIVTYAGTNTTALVNSSYNLADPEQRARRLINTVEAELGIDLQHLIEIDLDGFRRLVDVTGGVSVCFELPTRDRNTDDTGDMTRGGTGFHVGAGVTLLDGDGALQFVRSRRLYQEVDGEWKRLGVWSDLERNARQSDFIARAIDQAFGEAVSSPKTLRRVLDIVAANFTTSDTISIFGDGVDLARIFGKFDASQLERYSLDFVDDEIRGVSGLALRDTPNNRQVLDVFRGIGWDAVVESRVSISVAGADAGPVVAALGDIGFSVARNVGAFETTVVRYGPGGADAAALLMSHLSTEVQYRQDRDLNGLELVLEVGSLAPKVSSEYRLVSRPPDVMASPDDGPGTQGAAPTTPAPVVAKGLCD